MLRLITHRFCDLKLLIQLTNSSSLSASSTVFFPPPFNRLCLGPLSAMSALSFRHSHTHFSSIPNLRVAPLLLSLPQHKPQPLAWRPSHSFVLILFDSLPLVYTLLTHTRGNMHTLNDTATFISGRRLLHSQPAQTRYLLKGGIYYRAASIPVNTVVRPHPDYWTCATVSKQNFDYSFFYSLGLEDQFSAT